MPARIAGPKEEARPKVDLEHGKLPDPVLGAIHELLDRQGRLEERVRQLEVALARAAWPKKSAVGTAAWREEVAEVGVGDPRRAEE